MNWLENKLENLDSYLSVVGIEHPERVKEVVNYLKITDLTDLPDLLVLNYDLGPIDTLKIKGNTSDSISFQVKGVVNMWGAVHDLDMLGTSPNTAILSFHGSNDHVVPYGFGYPFDGKLDDYSDRILDAVSFHNERIYDFIVAMMPKSKALNELAFRQMYGSERIDGLVRVNNTKMRRSELHTLEGGGHSLHRDGNTLSPYFYDTILPVMTCFLYEEIIGGKQTRLVRTESGGMWFEAVDCDNVAELHWFIEGGAIIDQ